MDDLDEGIPALDGRGFCTLPRIDHDYTDALYRPQQQNFQIPSVPHAPEAMQSKAPIDRAIVGSRSDFQQSIKMW